MTSFKKEFPPETPMVPKGTSISRRLLMAIAGLIGFIIFLFVFFLHHYGTQAHVLKDDTKQIDSENDTAGMMIQKIQNESPKPVILVDPGTSQKINNPTIRDEQTKEGDRKDDSASSDDKLKEAGDAPISVYENTQTEINNSAVASSSAPLAGEGNAGFGNDAYSGQNSQSEKVAFLKNTSSRNDRIQSNLQTPISNYEVKAGAVIPATLMTGINSDLPGPIIAKVREDVFDTATGNFLLIPQGSTLMGVYDSQITYGQSRVLIVWSRLIFPNGNSFDLEGMPGADLQGMAGLHDLVNNHYWRLFGSALMMSAFGAAGQMSQPQNNTGTVTTQQLLYAAIGQQMGETGAQLMARNMNIQPTNEIRPGTNFNVLLTRDMVLPSTYQF
jgi:type IV secretion system protein VirB10